MVPTKLRQRGVDGDACQPGSKPRSFVKILDMGEGIQKTILHCVFRVFAISHHPMDDTEKFFAMALAKFSEGGSSSSFGGCYQLVLAPGSKVANLRGIIRHR
jgi:hypothetical protein